MSQAKYGSTVRVPHGIYEKVTKAANDCGVPVGTFIADALEDVLAGLEAGSPILPRAIDKRIAHNRSALVKEDANTTKDDRRRKKIP